MNYRDRLIILNVLYYQAKKIKHIHLYHNYGHKFDHLPFEDRDVLIRVLTDLQARHIKATITLEIFNQLVANKKSASLKGAKRHQVLLQQLSWLRAGVNPVIT